MRLIYSYTKCTLGFAATATGFSFFLWNVTSGESPLLYVAIFVVTYFIIGSGTTVGYHRYGTHRAFTFTKVGKWLARPFFLIAGSCAFQSSLRFWVAAHHKHHQNTDTGDDPHSPNSDGPLLKRIGKFLWAHMFWIPHFNLHEKKFPQWSRFDWFERFITRLQIVIALIPPALVWYFLGWQCLTAYLGAIFVWWHVTASVNSVTHLVGYRRFDTRDKSTNLWLLALVSFGEGIHNGHHVRPSSAKFAYTWWESLVDLGWHIIRLMRALGQVQKIPVYN